MHNDFAGKRVLITGGAGFIGAHLSAVLAQADVEVHIIARSQTNTQRFAQLGVTPIVHQFDLTDLDRLVGVVEELRPAFVFNLAVNRNQNDWLAMVQTNLVSAMTLLQACTYATFERFISIDSALATADGSEISTPYGANRAAAGVLLRQSARQQNIPIALLGVDYVYGPLQDETKLIPTAIRAMRQGQRMPVSFKNSKRDYVHVFDVVAACFEIISSVDNPFVSQHIRSGSWHSVREVMAILGQISDLKIDMTIDDNMSRDWDRVEMDAPVYRDVWAAPTDLTTGLTEMIQQGAY